MCLKHLGKCFVLRALHRLPSHLSVFTFCFPSFNFFSMTVFKREIISQYQKCSKYFGSFTGW